MFVAYLMGVSAKLILLIALISSGLQEIIYESGVNVFIFTTEKATVILEAAFGEIYSIIHILQKPILKEYWLSNCIGNICMQGFMHVNGREILKF